jgi:hypothetical protein
VRRQVAADQRLSGPAADIQDAAVTGFDRRHYAAGVVRIGRYRQFQPVVIRFLVQHCEISRIMVLFTPRTLKQALFFTTLVRDLTVIKRGPDEHSQKC